MLTVSEALQTVKIFDLKSIDFLRSITCGIPASPICTAYSGEEYRERLWGEPGALFLWTGTIPDMKPGVVSKPGEYVVANPYSCDKTGVCTDAMLKNGSGLVADAITRIAVIQVEVDEGLDGTPMSLADQAAAYDRLEAATGLRLSAIVMSGDGRDSAKELLKGEQTLSVGKSLHAFLAIQGAHATPEGERLRHRASSALCAALGGDYACRDRARKMRYGGRVHLKDGKLRVQTLLRAERTSYPLALVVERLEAYAASLSVDVAEDERRHHLAKSLRSDADSWTKASVEGREPACMADSAAETLRSMATIARQKDLTADQMATIAAVGMPAGTRATRAAAPKGPKKTWMKTSSAEGWSPDTLIVKNHKGVEATVSVMWAQCKKGYGNKEKVSSLHCPFHDDARPSAWLCQSPDRTRFKIICNICGTVSSQSSCTIDMIPVSASRGTPSKVADPSVQLPLTEEDLAPRRALQEAAWRHDLRHNLKYRAHNTVRKAILALPEVDRLVGEVTSSAHFDNALADFGMEGTALPAIAPDKRIEILATALERFDDEQGRCQRGPGVYRTAHGKVSEWRLPCASRDCDLCGPRIRRAEKAAISAVVGHLPATWLGACLVAEGDMSPSSMDAWVDAKPDDRHWLTVAVDADQTLTLLLWSPEGMPSPTVMANLDSQSVSPADVWGKALERVIPAGSRPKKNSRAMRGTLAKQGRVARDYLLGRRPPQPSRGKAYITKASSREAKTKITAGLNSVGLQITAKAWERKAGDGAVTRGETLRVTDVWGNAADQDMLEGVMIGLGIFQGQSRSDTEAALNGSDDSDGFLALEM